MWITVLLCAGLSINLCLTSPCTFPSVNPCTNYQPLEEPHRSIKFTASNTSLLLCDKTRPAGWYRFTSYGKDVDMPTSCVDFDRCGTRAPIWLDGKLPHSVNDGAVAMKACINRGHGADLLVNLGLGTKCCHENLDICVHNCGAYNVYYLVRPPACSMAYCAGDQQVCPYGKVGPSCSKDLYPKMSSQPILEHRCDNSASKFRCKIPYDQTDQSAKFRVTWLVDGKPLVNPMANQNLTSVLTNGDRTVEIPVSSLIGNIGKRVQCAVTSFYQSIQSDALKSNGVATSITATPPSITVSESGRPQNVKLSTSIPFCSPIGSTPSCSFGVEIKASDNYKHDTSTSACTYQFKYNSRTHQCEAIVPVIATRDFVRDGNKVHQLAFRPIALSTTFGPNINSIAYFNHTISPIQVTTIDKKSEHCTSNNDPHISTLSHQSYNVYETGYIVMYRTKASCTNVRHLEVQLQNDVDCSRQFGFTCSCGMVAVEGNDFVEINACTRRRGVHYLTTAAKKTDGTTFHTDSSGRKFYINFPSGARITVRVDRRKSYFTQVSLQVPSDQQGCAEGACGSFLHKPSNYHQYSLNFQNSLFCDLNKPTFNPGLVPGHDYCPCDNRTRIVSCTGAARNPLKNVFNGGNAITVKPNRPHLQTSCQGHNVIGRSVNVKKRSLSWPTPSGFSQSFASSKCKASMLKASLYSHCKDTIYFYSGLIKNCMEDILASDSLDFVDNYVSTYNEGCQLEMSTDVNNYVIGRDGDVTLASFLTSDLCPNECSLQGMCQRGQCVCNNGFHGPDCSVKVGSVPVVHFVHGSNEFSGLCDRRVDLCSAAFVRVDNIFLTDNLKCNIQLMKKVNGSLVIDSSRTSIVSKGLFMSSAEVQCPLPASQVLHGFIIIFDENHSTVCSEFRAYGSVNLCKCNSEITSRIDNNTCLIDGYCRQTGEQNLQQQACEPKADQFHWTTDSKVQEIDHYTATSEGCECEGDPGSFSCACCENGGCPCGPISPHQCIPCGRTDMCG